jgi:predicted nucleic acid-binding protein
MILVMRPLQLTGFCGHLPQSGLRKRIYARSETLHAPHLLDLEMAQVLRRLTQQGVVSGTRADEAVRDLLDLRVTRYPHLVLASHLAAPPQFPGL